LTKFRPCIDLHEGKVKQIVGGSLSNSSAKTNFVSRYDATFYASLYQNLGLSGGHVISLGPNNQHEVEAALRSYPKGLQYGGGVTPENAAWYLEAGADKVIVTSFLFEQGELSWSRLSDISSEIGAHNLVIDLSCRRSDDGWMVATDRWQTLTRTPINQETIEQLQPYCSEFLIHSADVEGLRSGIDRDLVSLLGGIVSIPTTYAGGATSIDDLKTVQDLSGGKVDLTIGSALDIFGGSGVSLDECVQWNNLA
jgi:phosphoribosylformimino-5-aminoimidazole carboxamide ribotide isomerase